MAQNLKARLARFRSGGKTASGGSVFRSGGDAPAEPSARVLQDSAAGDEEPWPGWEEAGYRTLKRVSLCSLSLPLPAAFPRALAILVPDIFRLGNIPAPGELLFFDLETTGLSGGAGTIAFLAAFGRFVVDAGKGPAHTGGFSSRAGAEHRNARLQITQYLLLDYPGENDFVENVVKEFSPRDSDALPLVVSFNGKSFDSQILRNRCLMNGIAPPEYHHADLLHPARRLWRRVLPDCSQATIETSVLALDRSGDVSGALAPEIWFSFLKTGARKELLSICAHNKRDISGLAELFLALGKIAAEPAENRNQFRFDEEALALFWKKALRQRPSFFGDGEKKTGELLLETAAGNGAPLAALALAKDAEWRLKDFDRALRYTRLALAAQDIPESLRENLEKRRERLEKKSLAVRKAARREK